MLFEEVESYAGQTNSLPMDFVASATIKTAVRAAPHPALGLSLTRYDNTIYCSPAVYLNIRDHVVFALISSSLAEQCSIIAPDRARSDAFDLQRVWVSDDA